MHAGIADARMWEPIVPWFQGHEPISYDLRGYGQMDEADGPFHHADDLLDLLDGEPAVLVGASMGARVALEAAVLAPRLVLALVLLAPAFEDWEWSAATRAYGEAEERFLAAGDLDEATALSVRFWVVGAGRSSDAVPREVLELVTAMQRRALAVQGALRAPESPRVAALRERLPEITAPVLVVVGEHDITEVHEMAQAIHAELPQAQFAQIRGAAHLPALEAPEPTGRLIAHFLKAI